MKVTKYGHCSLYIEHQGLRVLTDPGIWSDLPTTLPVIDVLLITHEHGDHLHTPSVKNILAVSPSARVISNSSVAAILAKEGITIEVVDDGKKTVVNGISIEGFGKLHGEIYEKFGQVENTGYMIGDTFFYPGDSFYNPSRPVDILALPVAGPWMHMREAINYAKEMKPRVMFPVHDGFLRPDRFGPFHFVPQTLLKESGLTFIVLPIGEATDL